ncbi:MAG: cell division protein ZapA [Pseudomonadota bacterium]
MPDIDVEINGRSYRLACEPGQEARLRLLAERLDGFARRAAEEAGGFSELRTIVMAGLLAVDALDEAERREGLCALASTKPPSDAAPPARAAKSRAARDKAV